jgi:hypothetical protein
VVERVGSWLSVIEVGRWDPFGVAVGAFAGEPAVFDEFVVGGQVRVSWLMSVVWVLAQLSTWCTSQ